MSLPASSKATLKKLARVWTGRKDHATPVLTWNNISNPIRFEWVPRIGKYKLSWGDLFHYLEKPDHDELLHTLQETPEAGKREAKRLLAITGRPIGQFPNKNDTLLGIYEIEGQLRVFLEKPIGFRKWKAIPPPHTPEDVLAFIKTLE